MPTLYAPWYPIMKLWSLFVHAAPSAMITMLLMDAGVVPARSCPFMLTEVPAPVTHSVLELDPAPTYVKVPVVTSTAAPPPTKRLALSTPPLPTTSLAVESLAPSVMRAVAELFVEMYPT